MRKIYFTILIAGLLVVFAAPLKAQVHLNLNVNISSQPIWGPVGYDDVQYYYLPAIDVYYYVPRHQFIYKVGGRWTTSSSLPPNYRNYDLYGGYKVVINENKPYLHDQDYREKYGSYKDRHDQQPIRDSRDSKYFVIKNHPEHNNWIKQQTHNTAHGKAQGKGNKQKQNNKQSERGKQDKQDQHGNHKK
jgi:hypothetical protein